MNVSIETLVHGGEWESKVNFVIPDESKTPWTRERIFKEFGGIVTALGYTQRARARLIVPERSDLDFSIGPDACRIIMEG